jgi:hypothetical protein
MSKRLPHGGCHLSRARFEGTFLRFGLVLFAAIARLPDRQTQAVRASRAKKRLNESRKRCSDSIFRPVAAHGVTQIPVQKINQGLRVIYGKFFFHESPS